MSEVLQFEHHPDADQIGAFVEHALPAHEQEQMLGHLAVCQECRAVVALSLPSVAEPAKPKVAPARRPWWSGWTLAWPALAVTAALTVFVVYIHHAKGNPGSVVPGQQAELHQTVPLESPRTAPAPIPEPPAARSTKQVRPSASATSGGAVSLSRKGEQRTAVASGSKPQSDSNVVSTLVNSDQAASVNANKENATPPQSDSNVVSTLITSQEISELPIQGRNVSSLAELAPGVSNNKAVTSANPAKSAPSGDAKAVAAGSSVASLNSEPEFQSQRLKHRLPSHLPVLSMVVHDRRMIAIDTRNTVFLSADAGKHWKSIQEPWTGRPVLVELASTGPIVRKPVAPAFTAEERSVVSASTPAHSPAQSQVANPASTGKQDSILTGVVTDQTGAIISGAIVRIINPKTGESHSVMTDSSGLYTINALLPGTYDLKVTESGFEMFDQASVKVAASAQTVLNARLTIGAETQTIAVQADALAVQADSNVVSTLIAEPDQISPVFEITTDNLDHWTSTDGITWKRK